MQNFVSFWVSMRIKSETGGKSDAVAGFSLTVSQIISRFVPCNLQTEHCDSLATLRAAPPFKTTTGQSQWQSGSRHRTRDDQ